MRWHTAVFQPLMGTVVEVQAYAGSEAVAEDAYAAAVAEIDRLTPLLSTYDPGSEICRWRRGEVDPGPELTAVLALCADWHRRSGGAYHPGVGVVVDRWRRAEVEGVEPSAAELDALALDDLPYRVDGGRVVVTGDCSGIDVNALAKGWVVDRALAAARDVGGVAGAVVNAGGDLVHGGEGEIAVAVEDPNNPFDNADPLGAVSLRGAALASSGLARRGFRVGEKWFGHVVDPRTARPVEHVASVTVLAGTCAEADAAATWLGVVGDAQAAAVTDLAWLRVRPDGSTLSSPAWEWLST